MGVTNGSLMTNSRSNACVEGGHGTVDYMAPELFEVSDCDGDPSCSNLLRLNVRAVDVYALGIVLWSLVACIPRPYLQIHPLQVWCELEPKDMNTSKEKRGR